MNKPLLFFVLLPFFVSAQIFDDGKVFIPQKTLAIKLPDSNRKTLFPKDPVMAQLVKGTWQEPKAGQSIDLSGEKLEWTALQANDDGWFEDKALRGGYAYFKIELSEEQVVLLEGLLHDMVFVNGTPRIGNRYQWKEEFESWEPRSDYSLMPVKLKKGVNHLLFKCARGGLKVKIHPREDKIFFNINDRTYPDILMGEKIDHWAATILVNATAKMLENAALKGQSENGLKVESPVPAMLPFSVQKVKFKISGQPLNIKEEFRLPLKVIAAGGDVLAKTEFPLRVTDRNETYRRTFISPIDGSVQYYAVNEALIKDNAPKALYLSLHGANVEAWNQANAYYPKHSGHIVAPTNRRPFGYNWEDWGRLDALEVLEQATENYNIAEDRIYLTGHSMGGHGTWILGATYPDKFASIGPSAGWISFWTYRFREEMNLTSDAAKLLMRSANPHNTFALAENFSDQGIYILHGKDDDNVRIDQAYKMIDRLKELNKNYLFHEEQDAGHWWDKDEAPGAQCVDWPPMFDLFNSTRIPRNEEQRKVNFITFNPGISAWDHWAGIFQQQQHLEKSSISATFFPGLNRFVCTPQNIQTLAIDVSWLQDEDTLQFVFDTKDTLNLLNNRDTLFFAFVNTQWQSIEKPPSREKNPRRNGTFKDAFNHNVLFVIGTQGNAEQNTWALEKARYDAETFWYQGNASVDIIFDHQFDANSEPDRSVILYGNSESNSAWSKLLNNSPVRVTAKHISVGNKTYSGSNLAAIFIRPRLGSDVASVGVVAGTGIEGMRLTGSQPYLYAGHGFPDFLVIDSPILLKGDNGVRAAGFFNNDWSLSTDNILLNNN